MKKRKNGPVVTYRFISDEHRKLFDAGKLSFEDAVYVKEPDPVFNFVTQYEIKEVTKTFTHYVYPNMFNSVATRFAVVNKDTGEVNYHKYLYTNALLCLYDSKNVELYVTNIVLG